MSAIKRLSLALVSIGILVASVAVCGPAVPQPPLIGTLWHLHRVIKNGVAHPPFRGKEQVQFVEARLIQAHDGCNSIRIASRAPPTDNILEMVFRAWAGKPTVTEFSVSMTAAGCVAGYDETGEPIMWGDEFYRALTSFTRYEIRDNELWLYYAPDNALVFQPQRPTKMKMEASQAP